MPPIRLLILIMVVIKDLRQSYHVGLRMLTERDRRSAVGVAVGAGSDGGSGVGMCRT